MRKLLFIFACLVILPRVFAEELPKIPIVPPVLTEQEAVDAMRIDQLIGGPYSMDKGPVFIYDSNLIKIKEIILEMDREGHLAKEQRAEYLNSIIQNELGDWNQEVQYQKSITLFGLQEQAPKMNVPRLAAALVLIVKMGDITDVSTLLRLVPLNLPYHPSEDKPFSLESSIGFRTLTLQNIDAFGWSAASALMNYPEKTQPLLVDIVANSAKSENERGIAAYFLDQQKLGWKTCPAYSSLEPAKAALVTQAVEKSKTINTIFALRTPASPEVQERRRKWEEKMLQKIMANQNN